MIVSRPRSREWMVGAPVCVAFVLVGCATIPARPRATPWRDVFERALDLAEDDRPDVDRARARREVELLAGRLRTPVFEAMLEARAAATAETIAEVLFRKVGFRGDPRDPQGESRALFDVDRVLATRRGTCLAIVVIALAALESARVTAMPVLEPGHARVACGGFLIDPATGGVIAFPPAVEVASAAELEADLLSNRATYRLAAGRAADALVDADRAAAMASRLATPVIHRAAALLALNRPVDAYAALVAIEDRGRGTAVSAYNLGLACTQLGRLDEATRWVRVATTRDPLFVHAWTNLGLLYERRGELVSARSAFETALAHDPDCEVARRRLAVLAGQPERR